MKKISFALLLAVLFMFVACGEDPSPFNQTTSDEAGKDCEQEGTFKCDGKFLLQCAQKEATENQGTETNDQDVAAENQDTETNDQDVATDQGTEINDNDQNVPAENTVTYAWKQAETCETAEACNATAGVCESPDSDSQPVADNDVTEPTSDADTTTPDADVVPTDTCANDNLGKQCTTDTDCGECMICVTGGKCVKGCTDDADCTMAGTHCNKKLARCLSTLASGKACDETSCPTGCCYAEKGLTGLKCATGASATASTCGLCPQYQIYSPTESKCITAVCSTTTDDCPSINSGATNPPAKCYACKSGEYICKANTSTSGCSAGTVINAAQCVPAGQQCVEGVSECCSGMPCVQGYCY
jgi:hypothetical protein